MKMQSVGLERSGPADTRGLESVVKEGQVEIKNKAARREAKRRPSEQADGPS